MKKLGTAIYYECATSFKYIWIFYAVIFAVIASVAAVIFMGTGSMEHVGTNAMEINSMVYVGILGALGFKEDFKMLIQNGFTRAISEFCHPLPLSLYFRNFSSDGYLDRKCPPYGK